MMVDDDFLNEGTMFDGSSIAGWKAINESDMLLKPDLETAVIDPFFAQTTLILICDVLEPLTGQHYARCPRSIAKAAEAFVNSSGVGDTTYFGPEAEFFIFDDVRSTVGMNKLSIMSTPRKAPTTPAPNIPKAIWAIAPKVKGGYFPVPPVDSEQDMRGEMLAVMRDMASTRRSTITKSPVPNMNLASSSHADQVRRLHADLQVCDPPGRPGLWQTATFMPSRSMATMARACMSTSRSGRAQALFAGSGYADLSDTCLLLHRRHHQACQGAQCLHQPADQQLQAVDPGL